MTQEQFAQAFAAGVAAVGQLGGAQAGDKTMLDALLPAAEALALSFDGAADAARAGGAEATVPMRARKGRAS
ncbi:dihydroxyacetone kinase subunit L [Streptomyces californicus]